MTSAPTQPPCAPTDRSRDDASTLFARNRAALLHLQPDLAGSLDRARPSGTPVLGRDGSPTFLTEDGSWWAACSIPRAASRAMLEFLKPNAPVLCFLFPFHPAALTETLRLMLPHQSVIALLPDDADLYRFLACDDFSDALRQRRLLFATSVDSLAGLLRAHPGLPLPGTFIRTPGASDTVIQAAIQSCQAVFETETDARTRRADELRARPVSRSRPPRRLIVSASTRFKLWDDAASHLTTLAAALPDVEVTPWCSDDPLSGSPLHLLELTTAADALLAADFFRADARDLLPRDLPVITWVTGSRLPAFADAAPMDRLILADATFKKEAKRLGWPEDRIALGSRPARVPARPPGDHLALIASTIDIRIPAEIEDFSSHRLLWERVEAELKAAPLRVGTEPAAYLDRVRQEMDIPADGFPFETLIERLVIPLWQQELVRKLLAAGVAVKTYGSGWTTLTDIASAHAGEITSESDLDAAIDASAALILPAPLPGTHPADSSGQPVLRPAGDLTSFLRRCSALTASSTKPVPPTPPAALTTPPLTTSTLSRLFQIT